MIKLKYQTVFNESDDLKEFREPIYAHHNSLHSLPKPNDFIKDWVGWVDLPANEELNKKLVSRITSTKRRLKRLKVDTLVVVGVGGSMLGTKAVYDIVRPSYAKNPKDEIELVFIGYTMNERHLKATLDYLKGKNFAINLVSRSGSTIETKVGFQLVLRLLKESIKDGKSLNRRILVTSTLESPLHGFAEENKGIEFFEIPEDIGGRYSTLTAVGLLPLGVAGIDIASLLQGAYEAYEELIYPIPQNPAYLYACSRAALYSRKYKKNELGVVFEPSMEYFMKWWRMVFAESEGKDGWGLFPAIALYTSDLHTLGQWLQDGDSDYTFESFHIIRQEGHLSLNEDELNDEDKILANHTVADMEYAYLRAALDAHRNRMSYLNDNYDEKVENPIPHIVFEWDDYSELTIGYALYFFQKAAAMYSLLIGVNPFDQPGLEAYKKLVLEYIEKGGMYKEVEDAILDYTPPVVDLVTETEEEIVEKSIVEKERSKDEIDFADTDEFMDDIDESFDEADIYDGTATMDEPEYDEFADERISEEDMASISEESPDSRVAIDYQAVRERVGIEEVGEIMITIKPNRKIVMPNNILKSQKKATTKSNTKKVSKKVSKKTSRVAAKKVVKKTTSTKKASSSSRKKTIKMKAASSKKRAFTKINF